MSSNMHTRSGKYAIYDYVRLHLLTIFVNPLVNLITDVYFDVIIALLTNRDRRCRRNLIVILITAAAVYRYYARKIYLTEHV